MFYNIYNIHSMNHLFKLTFLSFVFFTLSGCDKEKETIPSYLHIKKFKFSTVVPQGLNTSDISSAKVFADGNEVGTFELPVTIPILVTGDVEITLLPNIKENGSSNYHKQYIPYQSFIKTINFKKERIDTIEPFTTYRPTPPTVFAWMEDFEDAGIALEKYGINNTNDSILRIPTNTPGVDQPFTGSNHCGLIDIQPSGSNVDLELATSPGWIKLPNLGTDVYVEMDFKSNVNVQVGIYTESSTTVTRIPVVFTYPTEKWKKIYINLKSEIGDLPDNTNVKVFFGVYKSEDISIHPKVYLDNLKLVYVK